jgi:hypothetical protein
MGFEPGSAENSKPFLQNGADHNAELPDQVHAIRCRLLPALIIITDVLSLCNRNTSYGIEIAANRDR